MGRTFKQRSTTLQEPQAYGLPPLPREHLPIGSGTVESACKVVAARMKGSGMTWTLERAQHMLQLRASIMSSRYTRDHQLSTRTCRSCRTAGGRMNACATKYGRTHRGGANAGSGNKSLTGDHDNALHERIDSDRPGSEEAVAKMHARLAALRSVSPPGHLQAVGQRSRAARQQRGGGATSGAPAEPPVRSRGACGDEQSSGEPSWTAPGHPPRRLATGGRSAADGKRCSGAR